VEALFKWKVVNLEEEDGDNNSFGEYWVFINLDNIEYCNIELIPMMDMMYFVYKFKNLVVALLILHEE
jgi:hypothetical protein